MITASRESEHYHHHLKPDNFSLKTNAYLFYNVWIPMRFPFADLVYTIHVFSEVLPLDFLSNESFFKFFKSVLPSHHIMENSAKFNRLSIY